MASPTLIEPEPQGVVHRALVIDQRAVQIKQNAPHLHAPQRSQ
jgi:hypothetical protein